jgi:YggT family protein
VTVTDLLCLALQLYWWVVLSAILLSWFQVPSDHPVGALKRGVDALTAPVLGPIRRLMPPMRIGGAGLDLSPLVLLVGLRILSRLICT